MTDINWPGLLFSLVVGLGFVLAALVLIDWWATRPLAGTQSDRAGQDPLSPARPGAAAVPAPRVRSGPSRPTAPGGSEDLAEEAVQA